MLRFFGREADGHAVLFGKVEEGADGDAVAPGAHTFVVLGVTFLLRVAGIEAAEAVVVAAAVFSHGVGEGEAEVPPMVVAGGDVRAGRLDAGGEAFDLVVERGGVGRIGNGRPGRPLGLLCLRGRRCGRSRILPVFGVEFLFAHRAQL